MGTYTRLWKGRHTLLIPHAYTSLVRTPTHLVARSLAVGLPSTRDYPGYNSSQCSSISLTLLYLSTFLAYSLQRAVRTPGKACSSHTRRPPMKQGKATSSTLHHRCARSVEYSRTPVLSSPLGRKWRHLHGGKRQELPEGTANDS